MCNKKVNDAQFHNRFLALKRNLYYDVYIPNEGEKE